MRPAAWHVRCGLPRAGRDRAPEESGAIVMHLEQRQVLARWDVLSNWREKQWWYTGVHDPKSGVYVSWFFIRVNVVDAFGFTVFDSAVGEPYHFTRKLYLDEDPGPAGCA
jgi:hypothetical protein